MPRADLILSLVKAGSQGDQKLFRSTVEAIAAEERAKQHNHLADQLQKNLSGHKHSTPSEVARSFDGGHSGFLYEVEPRRDLNSVILPIILSKTILKLIEEQKRRDFLRSYGLEPRHRILLSGPPGNGKTTLAEAIAYELLMPLFVVRYEAIVGSFLGETSSRLKKLFDFARIHQCVLFFDEFDTLGKERGDERETGEIKRVVSSLLLQIDALPSHVVIITATNHAELLDRAVWRRFQLRVNLPAPTNEDKKRWLETFQTQSHLIDFNLGKLVEELEVESFADLEQFCLDIHRQYVLSLPNGKVQTIIKENLAERKNRVSSSTAFS